VWVLRENVHVSDTAYTGKSIDPHATDEWNIDTAHPSQTIDSHLSEE
jgi:hypothetical protein